MINLRAFALLKIDPGTEKLIVDTRLDGGRADVIPIGQTADKGYVTGQAVRVIHEGRNTFRTLREVPA